MTAAPTQSSNGALAAVRELERSLDARQRAHVDAERIMTHARAEAQALLAEAHERGERKARERRDEVLAAAAQDASATLAQAEAFATALAETVAQRQCEIDDALLDIILPDRARER